MDARAAGRTEGTSHLGSAVGLGMELPDVTVDVYGISDKAHHRGVTGGTQLAAVRAVALHLELRFRVTAVADGAAQALPRHLHLLLPSQCDVALGVVGL